MECVTATARSLVKARVFQAETEAGPVEVKATNSPQTTVGADEADPRESPARFSNLRSETEGRSAGSDMAQGEVLTPALYARCYALCRSAIRSLPGHRDDQVLVAAVALERPDRYAGNEWGDWAVYLRDVLALGAAGCDGCASLPYASGRSEAD